MVATFQQAAEAVGATVKRFSRREGAWEYLDGLVGDGGVTTSLRADDPLCPPEGRFAAAGDPATAGLCLSRAEAGIAATGSLLLDLGGRAGRAATALAPVHAVFLDPAAIVPALRDLTGRLDALLTRGDGAYFSLTTGPSRTADIERVLTIGVHGAKELYILLLEGA